MNLKQKENEIRQIEDIIDFENTILSMDLIEKIASDETVRKFNEQKYAGCLYSLILRSLTHKSFQEAEAIALWNDIISHMERLNFLVGRNVGVVVASLDYLTNLKEKLFEPKIIEENKSTFIAEKTIKDTLTKLYCRDVFDAVLKKEIAEAQRNNTPLSLLMIDIDDFKVINDTYGHLEGDKVLRVIGSTINNLVREMDLAARYGGEELAVIMPNTTMESARDVAERIRKTIEKGLFDHISLTVSIGVSDTEDNTSDADTLIKNADSALYVAKRSGKNQVQLHNKNSLNR